VHDDEEIIQEYEREFDDEPLVLPQARKRNRGFWLVLVTMLLGGILLVVEIFANRPLVNAIGRAQSDLTQAARLAGTVRANSESYAGANAAGLHAVDPYRTYLEQDQAASAPGQVSVLATADSWAAATWVRGGCFYIYLKEGQEALYGGGSDCTGNAAVLRANQGSW
jgi:hypothetical protein